MRRDLKSDVLDRRSLRTRVGGDLGLLREMIVIFTAEYPLILDQLQQAIARGNSSAAEKMSHKLKGSLLQFSASDAAETAARLETMAKLGKMEEACTAVQDLRGELEELVQALNAVVSSGFTD